MSSLIKWLGVDDPLVSSGPVRGLIGDSSLANAFGSIIADAKQWTAHMTAKGGNAVADQVAQVFKFSPAQNDVYVYSCLANDKNLGGNNANKEATSKSGHMAGVLHLATKEGANKLHAQSMSAGGTWTNLGSNTDKFGRTSTTNGSTLTGSVSGTVVGLVGFWNNSSGGTFSVTIDGVGKGTFNCQPPGASVPSNTGQNYGAFSLFFNGLPNTAHTVVITVTSATNAANPVFISFIAGYINGGMINSSDPHVIANTTWDWTATGNTEQGTTTAQNLRYVQMCIDNVATARSLGLNVDIVNWNTIIGGNTSFILGPPDNIHPNTAGYALLLAATLTAIG